MRASSSNPNKKQSIRLGRSPWLLALAVFVLVGMLALLGWLLLNQDGEVQLRQIEGDGVLLYVPEDWTEEDLSQNESCQSGTLTCVAILSAPEDFNFSLTWYTELALTNVRAVDEFEWKKFRDYYPDAILFTREEIQVDGLPAIQRTFLQNDQSSTPIYLRQVYILYGQRLYLITARFFSAETMEAQAGAVDTVIESIKFTPIAK